MSQDVLSQVRERLNNLKASADRMVESAPQLLENEYIKEQWEILCQAHDEAIKRLENPVLSIATIGTTSSGKSTLTNALVGRRVAPIEASEMSGGVLRIIHADERTLEIEATEGAVWDTGYETGLSDEEIYNRCFLAMRKYHDQRESKRKQQEGKSHESLMAPQITVTGPLLPICDPSLLELPPGVGIQFIDLPGLKSIQDKANLAVIQPQVQKSVSLVALDYSQVDDEHRRRLLEELKQVVEYLRGRTDSMIFVLNRVDNVKQTDIPLEQRITKLKQEIKEALNLNEEPDIIPFTALFLYYAQCAWGKGSVNDVSETDQETRLRFLEAIFSDCSNILYRIGRADQGKTIRKWLQNLQDMVEDQEYIDDATLKEVLKIANTWSGGKELWSCLKKRVQESFSNLIILPAVMTVVEAYKTLGATVSRFLSIQEIVDINEINKQRTQLKNALEKTKTSITEISNNYDQKISLIRKLLHFNNPESLSKIDEISNEFRVEGFYVINYAFNDIKKDLDLNLISPVKTALMEEQGAFELRDKLAVSIPPVFAEHIGRAYDGTRTKLTGFQERDGYYYCAVEEIDAEGKQKLEHAERAMRILFQCVKEGIEARAEFCAQGKAAEFEKAMISLSKQLQAQIEEKIKEEFCFLDINELIEMLNLTKEASELLSLPPEIFNFTDKIKQDETTKQVVVGQETSREGSCFSSEKTRPIKENKKYIELNLPGPQMMAKQWQIGINEAEPELWRILSEWMIAYTKEVTEWTSHILEKIVDFSDALLDERLQSLQKMEQDTYFWLSTKDNLSTVLSLKEELVGEQF